jgi:CheY-like chemotaxis protein
VRILVIDDDPERRENFRFWFIGHALTQAPNFDAGLEALADGTPWDVAFLDHDLDMFNEHGQPQRSDSGAHNGQDIAAAIDAMPPCRRPRRIVVHSWNGFGAALMAEAMRADGNSSVEVARFGSPAFRAIVRGVAATEAA